MIVIPNIVDQVKANICKERNKKVPCYVNRASSIGYFVPELNGCLRRGVFERTHWQDKEPWEDDSLIRFAEGNNQERQVLKDLANAGIEIIEQQSCFEWIEFQISGHLDGVLIVNDKAIPVEIKSMSPNVFSQINTFNDFKKKPWTKAYMAQIMIYMLMKNIDHGLFILKDKSSGDLKQINVELDYELAEYCVHAAQEINSYIQTNSVPDRIKDVEVCKKCPFKLLCCPDINFNTELKIIDDPIFENRITDYLKLEEAKKEADSIYKTIRDRAKASAVNGSLNELVGSYRLTGKEDARGAFRFSIETI